MNNKSKFLIIAKRDYLNIVKSKGFIIGTFILPIFWLIIIFLPGLLASYFFEKTEMRIAVVDRTDKGIGKDIVQSEPNIFFLVENSQNELNAKILDEKLDAYFIIDNDNLKANSITVFTKGGGGVAYITTIEKVVGKAFRKHILQEKGLDATLIKHIETDLKVETKKVTKEGTKKDYTTFYSFFGYFAGLLLFMLIFLYGGFVMRGVVEEKANRIIEVLLSSAKPFDIMLGKVIGLGSVGLTQILIWIVLLSVISIFSTQIVSLFLAPQPTPRNISPELTAQSTFPANIEIPPIPFDFVIFFIIYFLLGYFLIASIYAAIGAAVDQEQDAQTLMTPINIIFLIPIFLITLIVANPDGLASTLLSLFPLFTPILMIARMSSTTVPFWQLALSVILLLLTILLCVKISAKVYRVGVLIYGKRPTFKEIFRWLRQA
ncbi:MAG: ABC transporter permease [Ignavibacteria bacterium]|nr:ABC transporter permease [Ignavibacteria bacterium]